MESHWRETDYRINSLEYLLNGISEINDKIINDKNEIYFFDGGFAYEESATVIGLAFIAMQNYINHTIADLFPSQAKHQFYNLDNFEEKYSKIDLLIALANVAKHKEEEHNNLQIIKHTKLRLEQFGILYESNICDILHIGLEILDKNHEIKNILEILIKWREKLIEKLKKI